MNHLNNYSSMNNPMYPRHEMAMRVMGDRHVGGFPRQQQRPQGRPYRARPQQRPRNFGPNRDMMPQIDPRMFMIPPQYGMPQGRMPMMPPMNMGRPGIPMQFGPPAQMAGMMPYPNQPMMPMPQLMGVNPADQMHQMQPTGQMPMSMPMSMPMQMQIPARMPEETNDKQELGESLYNKILPIVEDE